MIEKAEMPFLLDKVNIWSKIVWMNTLLPEVGTYVYMQSFKHDGSLHRTWCKAFVLGANDEHIVAVTDKAWVIESDGRKWLTREPAIRFFYLHEWFNVISMIRHTGIYYYCNIASPSLFDGEAIKNIDYDLDIKLFPDGGYQVLDEKEYQAHLKEMNYPEDIQEIVNKQVDILVDRMDKQLEPFSFDCVDKYYGIYLDMISDKQ